MPVYITVDHEDPEAEYELLQLLCKDEWEIAPQMSALEKWLLDHKEKLKPGAYVADVCFAVRKDAGTGGATFTPASMAIMAKLGISLSLSEYVIDANNGSIVIPTLPFSTN